MTLGFHLLDHVAQLSQGAAYRQQIVLVTQKNACLGTQKDGADKRGDVFGLERPGPAVTPGELTGEGNEKVAPLPERRAHHLADDGIRIAGRHQFLKHPHIAGGEIVVEIVA